ncbi:MAG TPA: hypothetical protein VIG40_03705 [Tissierellaceae bacterium]
MSFKLPFPYWSLNTNIKVFYEEETEDGVIDQLIYDGKCIMQERYKSILNENKQLVELTGKATFEGDIFKGKKIRGYVSFNNEKRTIYRGRRIRNPDNSIYSIELDLM